MHSRLYRNVLANYSWAENAAAFSNIHNDTGLFGITVSANSKNAAESMDVICKELLVLCSCPSRSHLNELLNFLGGTQYCRWHCSVFHWAFAISKPCRFVTWQQVYILLQALTKDVESQDLQRAKNAALGQVLINLESRAIIAEDIGRQVLTYGHR